MGSRFKGCFNIRKSTKHVDPLQWSTEIGKHQYGEFSFAVEQANTVLEDHSQVELFQNGTFLGIYDGHGGPHTAQFVCDHLFPFFARAVEQNLNINRPMVNNAFEKVDRGFIRLVRETMEVEPLIKSIGSCCLIGLIRNGRLYIANLGDSRAVLGYIAPGSPKKILFSQITVEHNANNNTEREALRNEHLYDRNVVVFTNGVWRVKGILQVTRAFGDAYMKNSEFAFGEDHPNFRLPDPIIRPVVTVDPYFNEIDLNHNSKFVIFASDGLWDLLTNEEAANIVHKYPREGIAKRLIDKALKRLRKVRNMSSKAFNDIKAGDRRQYHDDITVIVVFLDNLVPNLSMPRLALRGFGYPVMGPAYDLNAPPPSPGNDVGPANDLNAPAPDDEEEDDGILDLQDEIE